MVHRPPLHGHAVADPGGGHEKNEPGVVSANTKDHDPSGKAKSTARDATEPLTDKIVWENGNAYTYRLRASTFMQTAMLVPEAAKLGKKRWAIVYPNYEYGQAAVAAFKENMKKAQPDIPEVFWDEFIKHVTAHMDEFVTTDSFDPTAFVSGYGLWNFNLQWNGIAGTGADVAACASHVRGAARGGRLAHAPPGRGLRPPASAGPRPLRRGVGGRTAARRARKAEPPAARASTAPFSAGNSTPSASTACRDRRSTSTAAKPASPAAPPAVAGPSRRTAPRRRRGRPWGAADAPARGRKGRAEGLYERGGTVSPVSRQQKS